MSENNMRDILNEDLEIEVKIQVNDTNKLLQWLENNAVFVKEVNQKDHYFERKDKPFVFEDTTGFKDANEWLRVRFTDKGNNICYKQCHNDENGILLYCDEIETGIDDGNKVMDIFKILGYDEIAIVNKNRKSYKYNEYQFDVDTIANLGLIVEVEYHGKIENLEEGRKQILSFIESVGITEYKEVNTGYPQMLWNNGIVYLDKEN